MAGSGSDSGAESIVVVDGHRVRLTNLDKVLYPATGTTKAEVVGYYSEIAELMLPHCAGRPATRKRWVNGVGTAEAPGEVFFQKNLAAGTPAWVVRADLQHSDHVNTYPLVNNRATLVWLAQIASLEVHVPQWRFDSTGTARNPDRIVFDLDPGPGVLLPQVAHVAVLVRDILAGMGMDAVPVTSGSKGIHLYAALPGTHSSAQISALAKELARSLELDHPDLIVSEMAKAKRAERVFIDWSQNNANKTTVAPYSLRGRDEPFVATPRTWAELSEPGLRHLLMDEVLHRVRAGVEPSDPMAALEAEAHAHDTFAGTDQAPRDRLTLYRAKRDAAKTPEPVPVEPHGTGEGEALTFVIQEHHARRLHYDLRLSHEGVLVSWALPKGVPTDGGTNHLAVQTEDHPMEYATFSGAIPAGEYGAGHMTIWDSGTYELEKWREGKEVIVTLTGRPDGGLASAEGPGRSSRFALIRTGGPGRADNHWLIHLMAPHAGGSDRPRKRTSGTATKDAGEPADTAGPAPSGSRRSTPARSEPANAAGPAPSGPSGRLPSEARGAPYSPMLATAGEAATLDSQARWALEMKWDGVRAIVEVRDGRVRLLARSGRDTTSQYPEIAVLPTYLRATNAVLDGEIVALDPSGRPSFALLQPRIQAVRPHEIAAAAARRPVRLMLFDVLDVDGESVISRTYDERREILAGLLDAPRDALVQVPPAFDGDLDHAIEASRTWGLEGVMAKRRDSRYLPGRRGSGWVKIKHSATQEVVVGGWRPGKGGRVGHVGSLLLGVPDGGGGLRYVGRVGSGFSEAETTAWVERFAAVARDDSPLAEVPALDARDAHWVEPLWVAEVEFGEWTPSGKLRHPRWRGWRPDKSPEDVVAE